MRFLFFSWIRRPPRSTRTDTLVPCTTLFRSPRLTVQTRSPIASRDIDLFQQFEHIRVNFTVTTDSEAVRLRYEPSAPAIKARLRAARRSEEHTSELQSLMRISYAVFCLKKNTTHENSQIASNHDV